MYLFKTVVHLEVDLIILTYCIYLP